jgi:hypothetical protein
MDTIDTNVAFERKFKHGTNGYHKHKCRCQVCKKAVVDYRKQYKEKKKGTWLNIDFRHGSGGYGVG